MKPSVKVALICSLISIGIALGFYYSGQSLLGYELAGFINIFLLLISISIGVFLFKKGDDFSDKSFLEDIKIAMQGGVVFTILVSSFIYVYHSKIDTSIIDSKVNERMVYLMDSVPDETTYLQLQKDDITWQDKTYMDYLENQEDLARSIISAGSLGLMNALVGLLMTIFFSIFTTVILRKVVLR
jgi:hypothetical protein